MTVFSHLDDGQRGVVYRLILSKHPDFGRLDETVIIGVEPETDEVFYSLRIKIILVAHRTGPGGYIEARFTGKAVMFELYLRLIQSNVSTSLHIRDAFAGIVKRFAVNRDPHQVQAERIGCLDFAIQARNLYPFIIIEWK